MPTYHYPVTFWLNFGLEGAAAVERYVDAENAIEASAWARVVAFSYQHASRVPVRWSVLPSFTECNLGCGQGKKA